MIAVAGVLVLIAASILVAIVLSGIASTAQSSETNRGTSTSLISSSGPPTSTTSSSITPIPTCTGPLIHPYIGMKLNLSEGQALHMCIRFYYYSGSSPDPATVRLASQVLISGKSGHDATSNFTLSLITEAPNNNGTIQIGGPSEENEGYLAMYTIAPKGFPGVPYGGTYVMDLAAYLAPQFLGSQNSSTSTVVNTQGEIPVMECAAEFLVAFGSGLPNYGYVSGCTGFGGSLHGETQYPKGVLVAAIIGISIS